MNDQKKNEQETLPVVRHSKPGEVEYFENVNIPIDQKLPTPSENPVEEMRAALDEIQLSMELGCDALLDIAEQFTHKIRAMCELREAIRELKVGFNQATRHEQLPEQKNTN